MPDGSPLTSAIIDTFLCPSDDDSGLSLDIQGGNQVHDIALVP